MLPCPTWRTRLVRPPPTPHPSTTTTTTTTTTHTHTQPPPSHTITTPPGRYWTLAEEQPEEWQPEEAPLPSDCRYRQDLALLAAGDVKAAQAAKEALEQRQRQDAKLRGIH